MQTASADRIVEALHAQGWDFQSFTAGRHWVARIARPDGAGEPYEVDFDRSAAADPRRELAAVSILAGFAGVGMQSGSEVTAN